MKNKVFNFLKIAIVLSGILFLTNSCTKEKWYNDTDVWVNYITIKNTNWTWNSNTERYEVVYNLDISQNYYDSSVITASVFLYEGDVEVQTPLPYVRTWYDSGTNKTYTETLSYDVSFEDQSIAFYIQSSDLVKDDSALPSSYEIKYSFIYQNQ